MSVFKQHSARKIDTKDNIGLNYPSVDCRFCFAIFLASLCALSLAACGNQAPSLEEVEEAIVEGNVTLEDALSKGWVTQEWADEYIEKNAVPAVSKLEAHAIDDFTTQTLDGDTFTKDDISGVTFLGFIDPTTEEGKSFYQELIAGYDGVKEAGADILVIVKGEDGRDLFEDAPFQVILYNEEMSSAMKDQADMVANLPATGAWYGNGSILSSWSLMVSKDELADSALKYMGNSDEANETSTVAPTTSEQEQGE